MVWTPEPIYEKPDISVRATTSVLPYSARARAGMPVAAPVGWIELRSIGRSDTFTILDADRLLARSKSLAGRGRADQRLPSFG